MKKRALHYLLIFTIILSVSSCATDPLLRKYISGEWRPLKLGSLDLQKVIPDGDAEVPQYTQEDMNTLTELKETLSVKNPDGTVKKSTSEDFDRMIAEASTSYIFRSDGYGGRVGPLQPVKGTWKLKKKGTRLILKDEKTKEQFVLIIDSLTSKRMVATNKYLPGGMNITYLKVTDEAP